MKKDDIIDAAIEEFGRYDYDRASVNSIIEKSNTSKGTFYHYFTSKEVLYLALAKKIAEEKIKFFTENIEKSGEITENSSIFEMLKKQIGLSMKFALAYPQYAGYSEKAANETNLEIKEKLRSIVGYSANDYFKQLIEKDIEKNKIRDDLPGEVIYGLLTFMLTHFSDFLLSIGIKLNVAYSEEIMEYLDYYVDFLEHGLSKK